MLSPLPHFSSRLTSQQPEIMVNSVHWPLLEGSQGGWNSSKPLPRILSLFDSSDGSLEESTYKTGFLLSGWSLPGKNRCLLKTIRRDCWTAIPGSGGSSGEGSGSPLQCSCLENPMDGGAWWAMVHGVAKNRTRLSEFTFTFFSKDAWCCGLQLGKTIG